MRSARTVKQFPFKPAAAFSSMKADGPSLVWKVIFVAWVMFKWLASRDVMWIVPSCVCKSIDEATAVNTQPAGVLSWTVNSFMLVEKFALVVRHRLASKQSRELSASHHVSTLGLASFWRYASNPKNRAFLRFAFKWVQMLAKCVGFHPIASVRLGLLHSHNASNSDRPEGSVYHGSCNKRFKD